MKYDRILVRYGELSTKGRNRNKFVDKLKRSINRVIRNFPTATIEADRERMYILLGEEKVEDIAKALKNIFGIQSFSPAVKVEKNVELMKQIALSLVQKLYQPGLCFKVSAKRIDKTFELGTDEMNREFGAHLLINIPGLKVNVKQPDINLRIEVRAEAAYLYCENILGAGGYPVGSNGKAMLMLSGGIDSPVAGYLSLKRGVEIEGVHFYSPPFTSERAKQKVIDLTEKLANISGTIALHIVPFTEIQQMIQDQVPSNYTMTTTRRLMLRITDEIRRRQNGLAIITGESLGQVASQTLESMYTINQVTNTPILRPLVMMDKTEIISLAQQIDTYDISIRPFEDCCTIFVPSSPKTKPKLDKVEHFESFVDFEPFIQKAVDNTELMIIRPGESLKQNVIEDLF
ncbi:tRNA uracil 4-sulfurtransferase ThiI [Pseudoneobacillus rhizosphaerae]|uniref:Probable tRNA sulfurtransferase n=1 Tax=Pseudoneobacillus rhizosphaerae TaxID=2880968 RepID=A0A9C7LAW7_9BACI|nr:tRNA uracil 4-sulfurtransferase ThiI [Pseudoneobacillus rhizosphaerae]CAG9608912.1 putative tRNA sulfurtransferase [Pseudoneobacillus rhizosphaerae]